MKIYIVGPYTANDDKEVELNVQRAIDAGIEIMLRGHVPYIPHLTHYVDKRAKEVGIPFSWENYMAIDLPWLRECEAILFLGHSRGADIELKIARRLGKQIYLGVEEIDSNSKRVASIT